MKTVSLYIHIPFCKSRCVYCDFTSGIAPDPEVMDRYALAVAEELRLTGLACPDRRNIGTVYFGGGTPSLLSVRHQDMIWNSIHRNYSVHSVENTIEANPDDVTPDNLRAWKTIGFNRLSLGFQSLEDPVLTFLGRRNTVAQNVAAFRMAREAGFDNISVDWIASVPGENPDRTLKGILDLRPEHVSVYQLSVEEQSSLANRMSDGTFAPLPDDEYIRNYWKLSDALENSGYRRYEISNFAVSDSRQSRHNRNYWDFGEYIGVGLGASGFVKTDRNDAVGERWSNVTDMETYFQMVESGRLPEKSRERIDRLTALKEFVMLALRRTDGLAEGKLTAEFGCALNDILPRDRLSHLDKFLELKTGRMALNRDGTGVANEIIRQIWAVLED